MHPVPRLAFFVYAYNFAETMRGIEVARALRDRGAEVEFFSHGGPHGFRVQDAGFRHTEIRPQITPDQHKHFLDVDHGRKREELYSEREWYDLAKSEIKAMERYRPHAIYAGFNLPCVISARALAIPLIFLIPAQAVRSYYRNGLGSFPEFMENRATRLLPASWKNRLFNLLVQRWNYLPLKYLNRAARSLRAPPLRSAFDLLSGDLVLLSDIPEITGLPVSELPPNHHYIGALFPELSMELPREAKEVFRNPGLNIYCAMGSSGAPDMLRMAIQTLKKTNYNVVAATTSIVDPEEFLPFSHRFFVTRFLPAGALSSMAHISLTHGGQGTIQNSVCTGTPVIGTPFQPEQQTNLEMYARAGAAIKIPLRDFNPERIVSAIEAMAASPSYTEGARRLQALYASQNGAENAAFRILEFLSVSPG